MGVGASLLGNVFGVEGELSHETRIFQKGDPGNVSSSRVTKLTRNLIVGLPRSVWGGQDSAVAFTPPDRYLTTTTDAEGRFVLSGAVPGTEYKLFAFEDLDPNLTYDPDLVDRFPNRDLIDLEETAGTNAPLQNRTQQLRGQRSVRLQGSSAFRADVNTGPCSPSLLCVLRTISAEETRELNMGRN